MKLKEKNIANKLVLSIMEKIKILEIFPFAHKVLKKSKKFEYRKFIIKNYVIIYKISLNEKTISILHIYNQKQSIKNENRKLQEQNS